VSRPLPLGVTYPFDWGFVPSTRTADGDPLDAMLLWDVPSYPGVVVPCRAIGVLYVEQNRANHNPAVRIRNDRIISMPVEARREQSLTDLTALPARVRRNWSSSRWRRPHWKGRTYAFSVGVTRRPR
jgi:inorganic pyrophosphatase